jgi:hypothetical protein
LINRIDELANLGSRNFLISAQTFKGVSDEDYHFVGLKSTVFVSVVLLEDSVDGFVQLPIRGFDIHWLRTSEWKYYKLRIIFAIQIRNSRKIKILLTFGICCS